MSLIGYTRDIDRKFAWSFVGVLLAMLFGGITIQREFFSDSAPHLQYDILTSTPVLDVREDVSKVSVLFDGIDIRQQKKSLRVITIRVVNNSQNDILKGHYDDAEPLGLRLSSGKIIRSDLVTGSSPYLERQLVTQQQDDTTIVFPSVIIESQEYFVIKLLVLHDEGKQPEITPIGKIAGIHTIPVAEAYKKEVRPPFLKRTFAGSPFVQVVRLLAYIIAFYIVAIVIMIPAFFGEDLTKKWKRGKRRKIVEEFKQETSRELTDKDEFLFKKYTYTQSAQMSSMLSLISNPEALQLAYSQHEKDKDSHHVQRRLSTISRRMSFLDNIQFESHDRIGDYLKSGLIKKIDKELVVDEQMKGTLEDFVAFLKNRDLLPERDSFLVAKLEMPQSGGAVISKQTEETEPVG